MPWRKCPQMFQAVSIQQIISSQRPSTPSLSILREVTTAWCQSLLSAARRQIIKTSAAILINYKQQQRGIENRRTSVIPVSCEQSNDRATTSEYEEYVRTEWSLFVDDPRRAQMSLEV